MGPDNKSKNNKSNKDRDGRFHSKHVKHSPAEESARAAFGLREEQDENRTAGPV